MCYNFVVFLLSKSWHESSMWGSADWTLALANKAAAAVKGAAALHDAYLSTKDPQVGHCISLSSVTICDVVVYHFVGA
jgi:hypothetical protein